MTKRIIVLVGPSGSGKTSLGDQLSEQGLKKLVTTTTRTPRPGEVDGEDYYFRHQDELVESDFAEQTTYNGSVYGLTLAEIDQALAQNDIVHVSLDRHGARAVKTLFPAMTVVCFVSISLDEMAHRMKQRGDSAQKIQERVQFCQQTGELIPPKETDYVIKNDQFDQAVAQLLTIIDDISMA